MRTQVPGSPRQKQRTRLRVMHGSHATSNGFNTADKLERVTVPFIHKYTGVYHCFCLVCCFLF